MWEAVYRSYAPTSAVFHYSKIIVDMVALVQDFIPDSAGEQQQGDCTVKGLVKGKRQSSEHDKKHIP